MDFERNLRKTKRCENGWRENRNAVLERFNVFEEEVKIKVEMEVEVEESLAGICFTIFELQQFSMATEYSTLSVDLCEIPIKSKLYSCNKIQFVYGVACTDMNSIYNEPVAER